MRLGHLRRRDLITLFGGAAAAPFAAYAQQLDRIRRLGLLTVFAETDPEGRRRVAAFLQEMQQLGWTEGRNVRIDYRWTGGDPDRTRASVSELVASKPDAILVNNAL